MADNTIRTVLEIGGEKGYKKSLTEINSVLKGLDSEVAVLNAQYGKNEKSMTALIGKQTQLTSRLDVQKKKLELVRSEYERVSKKQGETSEAARKLQREYNYASAQFERTAKALEEVSREVEKNGSRFAQLKSKLDAVGISAQDVGRKMESFGNKMSGAAIAAAGATLTAAVGGWVALEDEMANVATIADTSEKSMEELTAEVIAASDAAGIAAKLIAQAQYQAISANVATADSAALVEKAAKAAKAGVSDVNTVIDGATSILNGWKIAVSDSEQVFDKLLKTQQRGKTTIGELASGIGQVTGLAPQLNMSLDETLAAVGALTQSGVGTSEAFNGLKAVMSSVLKPTSEAAEEAERLGLEFDSAALKSKGFTAFLADVVEKTGGSEESLAKLFGSVEGLSQIMLLGGSSAELYADILDDLTNSAGTLDEMFKTRTSSSAERFSMALNRINNAAIRLGQSFAPYIDLAADSVESLADSIAKMDVEEGKSLITTALWIAGAGKTISVVGKLIGNIESITKGFKAMGVLLSAGGPVIAGIMAVGASFAAAMAILDGATKAKISFDIDDSDLEKYKIDTQTLKDPITVQAEVALQIKSDLKTVGEEMVRWLSDGVPEKPEEQAAMAAKVNAAIDGAFNSIQTHFDEQKKALDAQLAAGIITQETYDASLAQLTMQATALESDLTTQANAVNDYVASLVAANETITESEIEHLNALLEVLGLTSAQVLEATNAQKAVYEHSYDRVKMGYGTEQDQRMAAEYIEMQYQSQRSQLTAAQNATRSKYAALSEGKSGKALEVLMRHEDAELAEIQAQIDALSVQRQAQYGELLQGIAEKEGIDAAEFAEYLKLSKGLYDDMLTGEQLGYENLVAAEARYDELAEKFPDMENLESFKNMLASFMANSDGMYEAEDAMIAAADAMMAVNQAAQSDAVKEIPEAYGNAGSNAVTSLSNALIAGESKAYGAGHRLGAAAEKGIKAALQINSPSKVFENIADNVTGTLAGGMNKGVAKVRSAGALLADAAVSSRWSEKGITSFDGQIARIQAAARQFNAPSAAVSGRTVTQTAAPRTAAKAGTTIVNNISYTAGAGTRREARMLSQRLAQEQKAALTAEGL